MHGGGVEDLGAAEGLQREVGAQQLPPASRVRDGAAKPPLQPAVPIRRSVTPDYIVCLEDGKKLKMLKRHLRTSYNLTPDEYRTKWQLGPDYPMVAPNYAKRRSEFAKQIGLGQKSRHKRGAKRA